MALLNFSYWEKFLYVYEEKMMNNDGNFVMKFKQYKEKYGEKKS